MKESAVTDDEAKGLVEDLLRKDPAVADAVAELRRQGVRLIELHWHGGKGDSAVGNTPITGETGSGKTTGTCLLLVGTVARIPPQSGGFCALDHKRVWNSGKRPQV